MITSSSRLGGGSPLPPTCTPAAEMHQSQSQLFHCGPAQTHLQLRCRRCRLAAALLAGLLGGGASLHALERRLEGAARLGWGAALGGSHHRLLGLLGQRQWRNEDGGYSGFGSHLLQAPRHSNQPNAVEQIKTPCFHPPSRTCPAGGRKTKLSPPPPSARSSAAGALPRRWVGWCCGAGSPSLLLPLPSSSPSASLAEAVTAAARAGRLPPAAAGLAAALLGPALPATAFLAAAALGAAAPAAFLASCSG